MLDDPFLLGLSIDWRRVGRGKRKEYPFNIPAIRALKSLKLHPRVTFFVGENGSGKSTLLEAIAIANGFNPEGGSRNFNFETRASHSSLHEFIVLDRGRNLRKPKDGFFFRAESFYNLATELEGLDKLSLRGPTRGYGDVRAHEQSHGEAFTTLVENRLWGQGIYIFDEPESALSPMRQLKLHDHVRAAVKKRSQLIIATHSPIILGYPDALILQFTPEGIAPIAYEDTEHFRVTRDFFAQRTSSLATLEIKPGDV